MHSHLHDVPASRRPAWRRLSALLVSLLLTLLVLPPAQAADLPRKAVFNLQSASTGVIYVDHDATGANNGTSWADAYTSLQSALAVPQPGAEIWVAEGVYTPGAARTDTFTLRPGVAVYGGFAGTETQRMQRDWTAHITVLSGDIDRNDRTDATGVVTSTTNIVGNNAYHIVTGSGVTQTATLDGFTITAGQANGSSPHDSCGGMSNTSSAPRLSNLIFSGNLAGGAAGGMCNISGSSPMLTNIIFKGNLAGWAGGGIYNDHSSPALTNVTFSDNEADFNGPPGGGGGAGMYNYSSSPTLTNVTFNDNRADWGGGMFNDHNNTVVLTNVIFTGNQAVVNGGGMFNQYSNLITSTNVLFSGNQAGQGGGMFNVYNTTATLTNVTFSGNRSTWNTDGGLLNRGTSTTRLVNSILWGNVPRQVQDDDNGGVSITYSDIQSGYTGTGTIAADPRFVDAATHNLDLRPGSPAVDVGDPNRANCPTADILGRPRNDARCDMGAYEFASSSGLLALYVLAFDNSPTSTMNLSAYYPEAMQSIIDATIGRPDVTALVLMDLSGAGNTWIYHIRDGLLARITSLPNAVGTLDPTLHEYDTTDPARLGGFIKWARGAYPAIRTTFSYVGHNAPLPPETNINRIFSTKATGMSNTLIPLPFHKGADPDFTDSTPANVLSTYDLAEALRIGTNDGANPIDVVDLFHCFGMSTETLYPLRSFARTVTGSPNYAYFAPELLGAGLQAMRPTMSAAELAGALVQAYDAALPPTEHPRILVAVDTSQLDAVKQAWDAASLFLWQGLDDRTTAATYRAQVLQAYRDSAKYDTTYCAPQDWELAPPDALVDLRQFADQLRRQFGELSDVGIAAGDTIDALMLAVITSTHHNGTPWFAAPQTPNWNFDGDGGISLYADLLGAPRNGNTVLSWHAHWYTETVTLDNPHPYAFIAAGAYDVTWADVFAKFWEGHGTIQTEACLPALPPVQENGELSAGQVLAPLAGTVRVGSPVTITVSLSTQQVAHGPTVAITVTQNNIAVFTDTVGAGYLRGGTYEVKASKAWTPTAIGPFTITFMVDADDRIRETNEADNTGRLSSTVLLSPTAPRPVIRAQTVNQQQWISGTTALLQIAQTPETALTPAARVYRLVMDIYQYQPGVDPNVQTPVRIDQRIVDPANLPLSNFALVLPPAARPGPVVVHIWPRSAAGGLGDPAIVRFNYVPPNVSLGANETHYFRFDATAGDQVRLNLAIGSGSARLAVWEPDNYWSAMTLDGSGTLPINSTLAGEYAVSVHGMQAGTRYTLSATHGTPVVPLSESSDTEPVQIVAQGRPAFVEPLPIAPVDAVSVSYLPSITR